MSQLEGGYSIAEDSLELKLDIAWGTGSHSIESAIGCQLETFQSRDNRAVPGLFA